MNRNGRRIHHPLGVRVTNSFQRRAGRSDDDVSLPPKRDVAASSEEAESLITAAEAVRDRAKKLYPVEEGRAFLAIIHEGEVPLKGMGWVWVNRALYGDPWSESDEALGNMDIIIERLNRSGLNLVLQQSLEELRELENKEPGSGVEEDSAQGVGTLHERWTSILRTRLFISARSLARNEKEAWELAVVNDGYETYPLEARVYHFLRRVMQKRNEAFLYRNPRTGRGDDPTRAVLMMIAWIETLEEEMVEGAKRFK